MAAISLLRGENSGKVRAVADPGEALRPERLQDGGLLLQALKP